MKGSQFSSSNGRLRLAIAAVISRSIATEPTLAWAEAEAKEV